MSKWLNGTQSRDEMDLHQRQKKTEVTMTLLTLARLRVRLRGRTTTHYGEYGKGTLTGVA